MFKRIEESEFEKVYPILETSFPPTELREQQRQLALLKEPAYRLYGMKDEEEEEYKGVIAAWEIEDFLYIEHFAVNPAYRSGGFGGKTLDSFVAWSEKQTVLEVEVPEDELSKRRVGFYERHSFSFNEYPYLQPPMREGQDMLPLRIMTTQGKIDENLYQRYKKQIYKTVYKFEGE